jgi:hypothetical protein
VGTFKATQYLSDMVSGTQIENYISLLFKSEDNNGNKVSL